MRPPRLSIRGLMGLVLIVAFVFHVSLAAIRVSSTNRNHMHTWVHGQGNKAFITVSCGEPLPFWPCYWRSLLGFRWKGLPLCSQVEGRLLDTCEFRHPQLRTPIRDGQYELKPTRSQIELQKRLRNQSP